MQRLSCGDLREESPEVILSRNERNTSEYMGIHRIKILQNSSSLNPDQKSGNKTLLSRGGLIEEEGLMKLMWSNFSHPNGVCVCGRACLSLSYFNRPKPVFIVGWNKNDSNSFQILQTEAVRVRLQSDWLNLLLQRLGVPFRRRVMFYAKQFYWVWHLLNLGYSLVIEPTLSRSEIDVCFLALGRSNPIRFARLQSGAHFRGLPLS